MYIWRNYRNYIINFTLFKIKIDLNNIYYTYITKNG